MAFTADEVNLIQTYRTAASQLCGYAPRIANLTLISFIGENIISSNLSVQLNSISPQVHPPPPNFHYNALVPETSKETSPTTNEVITENALPEISDLPALEDFLDVESEMEDAVDAKKRLKRKTVSLSDTDEEEEETEKKTYDPVKEAKIPFSDYGNEMIPLNKVASMPNSAKATFRDTGKVDKELRSLAVDRNGKKCFPAEVENRKPGERYSNKRMGLEAAPFHEGRS